MMSKLNGARFAALKNWLLRGAASLREDEAEESSDVSSVGTQQSDSDDVAYWLQVEVHELSAEKRAEGGRVLAEAAESLDAQDDLLAAFRCHEGALRLTGVNENQLSALPWLTDFVFSQRLASAKLADRLADELRETDDREALRWWRESVSALGQINTFGQEHREEVDFLHQKVLGEAAAASYRVGTSASDADDDAAAADAWEQAARLVGHLLKQFPQQPAWVTELHVLALRGSASTSHHLAKGAKDTEPAEAVRQWSRAAKLFGKLLKQYPGQPDWVVTLYRNILRNAGATCHELGRSVRQDDVASAARYWERSATFLDTLMRSGGDQPDWVSAVYENVLRSGAIACLDVAQSVEMAASTGGAGASRPIDVDDQRWRQRGMQLYTELIRCYPAQPHWTTARFSTLTSGLAERSVSANSAAE